MIDSGFFAVEPNFDGVIQPGGSGPASPAPQAQPVELIGREKARLYKIIAPALTGAVPAEKAANIVEIPQTVYKDCRFVAIQNTAMFPPLTKYALVKDVKGAAPQVVVFDWTDSAVLKANKMAGLEIDSKNAAAYARFFLNRVRPLGQTERLVESAQQLNLTTDPNPTQMAALAQIKPLQPVMVQVKQADGSVKPAMAMLGTLAKNNELYQTLFFVTADHKVIAKPTQLLAKGLDMRPDSEMPTPGSAGKVMLEAIAMKQPSISVAMPNRKPRGK